MTHPVRKFALIAVAAPILLVVLVLVARHKEPVGMAKLQLSGYATDSNQVKTAVFVLTNPGPAHLDYFTHEERSRTVTNRTNGSVTGHSTVVFRITLSDSPTRLVVNCATKHSFREFADEVSRLIGLKTPPRSVEYTLFSDELKK